MLILCLKVSTYQVLFLARPPAQQTIVTFRTSKDIDIEALKDDISASVIGNPENINDIDELILKYNSVFTNTLGKHAPEWSREVSVRLNSPSNTIEVKSAKRECQRVERKWHTMSLTVHKQIYEQALDDVACIIEDAKKKYYGAKVKSANQTSMLKLANSLMHKPKACHNHCISLHLILPTGLITFL